MKVINIVGLFNKRLSYSVLLSVMIASNSFLLLIVLQYQNVLANAFFMVSLALLGWYSYWNWKIYEVGRVMSEYSNRMIRIWSELTPEERDCWLQSFNPQRKDLRRLDPVQFIHLRNFLFVTRNPMVKTMKRADITAFVYETDDP